MGAVMTEESSKPPVASSATSSETKSTPRAIRRSELRQIVPLSDTTIYELERRGRFPRRFYLTPRCVAWDLAEVEAWLTTRRHAPKQKDGLHPDVRLRKSRPVKG